MKRISGKNLVLIGFMGTGKTEVGRLLAQRLNRCFVDTDQVIVRQEGKTIAEIFRERGEKYFRQLEQALAEELKNQQNLVIATGGGFVLNEVNSAALRQSAFVVWLTADLAVLRERLKDDDSRPLFNKETDFAALYSNRLPIYRRASHVRVDTAEKTPLDVAEEIFCIIDRNA
ncbi:MAG: shikimate kinase [Dethiobacter sp.]|nr:shikimate kinase [Dethiobacter sp.]MBS3901973.1 shikimate kinase [Dethiobacter sp.]MBS3988959.1 shikimate kinase [Dethiobacter sp.]